MAVAFLQGEKAFYGDSGSYWSLASTFIRDGHFSLLNFESPLRGYALPLINYVLQAFAEAAQWTQSSVAKLFNVLLFTLIGAVLAPHLAEHIWPEQRWGFRRRLVLTSLLVVFWSGYLNYPLSDFPALTMALLALVSIAHPETPGWMLIAGLAAGLAIDMRPAYLLLAPVLLVMVAFAWFGARHGAHGSHTRRMLCISLLAAGFAAVSLPQSLSADRYHNSWTFIPGGPAHLAEEQLTDGMVYQRYDTYAGPVPPSPTGIVYPDEAGRHLLEEQPRKAITSTSQYLALMVGHPLVMLPLLARHIIDGLDARYNTVYVQNLASGGHIWLRVTGFSLIFLALVRLLWPAARRRLGPAQWRYAVAMSLCCLTSVATRVETRYMLPIYVLSYVLVLAPGWPTPVARGSVGLRRFQTMALITIAYLAFMVTIWSVVRGVHGYVVDS